jgi:hypothetical protein
VAISFLPATTLSNCHLFFAVKLNRFRHDFTSTTGPFASILSHLQLEFLALGPHMPRINVWLPIWLSLSALRGSPCLTVLAEALLFRAPRGLLQCSSSAPSFPTWKLLG